jgi:hypothetical protein
LRRVGKSRPCDLEGVARIESLVALEFRNGCRRPCASSVIEPVPLPRREHEPCADHERVGGVCDIDRFGPVERAQDVRRSDDPVRDLVEVMG